MIKLGHIIRFAESLWIEHIGDFHIRKTILINALFALEKQKIIDQFLKETNAYSV